MAKTRLIENDYEVFAKYQGRSTIKTYLTSVIQRIYLDFQVQRFGKWRPSAEARRLGTMALRLEQLPYRDGLSFDEACGVLRSDPSVRETRDELDALRLRLPLRPSRRIEGRDLEPARPEGAATKVERSERQALADRMFSAIRCSLARLPARDRVFLRLHFQSRAQRGGRGPVARRRPEGPVPQERGRSAEAACARTSRRRRHPGAKTQPGAAVGRSTGRRRSTRSRPEARNSRFASVSRVETASGQDRVTSDRRAG